jgi:ribosomal protein S18 acetylase RimI-like enzyme
VVETLRIRRARADEGEALAPVLTDLSRRSKAHWGYDPELLRRWANDLRITPDAFDRDAVLLAELGDPPRIAGFARVTEGTGPALTERAPAQLTDLWIEPGDIGSGVGRALFAAACEVARTLPAQQLLVVADPHAEGFYRRMGARRIGEAESEVIDGRRLPILVVDLQGPGSERAVTPG